LHASQNKKPRAPHSARGFFSFFTGRFSLFQLALNPPDCESTGVFADEQKLKKSTEKEKT
jgi:hypothetical protein